METKMWLVRAASLAVVGTLTVAAAGQKAPKKKGAKAPPPAPPAAAAPAEPQKPPASTTPEKEEEGPFAPKGRTGKLKDEAAPEESDDKDKPKSEKPAAAPAIQKPGAVGADIVFGFGKTGGTTGPDAVELSVVSFVVGGGYHFTPEWAGRLRVPFATGKITHVGSAPSGFENLNEGYNAAAFGNVELAGAYTLSLGPSTRLPLELALAVPTATGDRFPPSDDLIRGRRYRINAAAQASRGLEEDALFAPHRFGIVPKGSIEYRSGAIDTDGFVKVPVLIKTGGEAVPAQPVGQATFALNSTVIMGVVGGSFHYGFAENKVDIGTRAWFTVMSNDYYDVLYPGGSVTQPSKFQFVLEPEVRGHFGAVHAVLGFIWPLGGRLGGDQQVNGLRLAGAYTF